MVTRVIWALLASSLLFGSTARGQESQGFKGLNASDLKKYCIFADQLFSEGSVFCTAKHYAIVCDKDGVWTSGSQEKLDPAFCDANPSVTPITPQY